MYMIKIGRKLYHECISDAEKRKALALIVYIKNHYKFGLIIEQNLPTAHKHILYKTTIDKQDGEVINHYLDKRTFNKRINTIKQMGLIAELKHTSKKHLSLKSIRQKYNNVDISKISTDSLYDIELGLQSLYIAEVQLHKNFVRQQYNQGSKPFEKNANEKAKNSRKTKNKYGKEKFEDNGISYKYIARKLNISRSKVSDAVKNGEHKGIFIKNRNVKIEYVKNVIFSYFKMANPNVTFCTKNYAYTIYANTYSLLLDYN